ncbi:MAG TPA: DUF362 domain-containing protein [Nitrospirae bacterium]|nr:ferredoxin-1 [bacterium BMS3Abin06]HDH12903.1 DUF362 domain-containing protein [Nitrospirota bacterium]HDZ01685.1 DUF362 domain-containing protein [Nitrospirota bacterium]
MPTIIRTNAQIDELDTFVLGKVLSEIQVASFKNKRVLIKPNWVNHLSPSTGATVDPKFIKSIVNGVKQLGANDVKVGEGSIIDTERAFASLDVNNIIGDSADLIDFSKEKQWIDIPINHSKIQYLRIPEIVHEFDTIVSVAKLKTHCQTRISFTVKNLFGLLSKASRQLAHKVDLENSIAGIYFYLMQRMNVVGILDGSIAMEGRNGPLKGEPVKLNVVISGDNASEVDYGGCLVIGCSPNTVEHLVKIENSSNKKYDISLIKGYEGDFPIRQFELPPVGGWRGPLNLSPLVQIIFKKRPLWLYEDRCTFCGECIQICPANCLSNINGKIIVNNEKCVECLCCSEVCSFGAMTYAVRLGWLHGALKNILKTINKLRQ